jgi:Tat protein secretion system quality control protein TatD with DNase activity
VKISELRQISLEELALATSANARDIFALPEESV